METRRETRTQAPPATMAEIERKLEELRARAGVDLTPAPVESPEPEPPPEPAPEPIAAAPDVDDAGLELAEIRDRLAELRTVAGRADEAAAGLGQVTGELLSLCADLISRLELATRLSAAEPDVWHEEDAPEAPAEPEVGDEAPSETVAPAPEPRAAIELDQVVGPVFDGTVRLDAGSFGDIAGVSAFVTTLAEIDGVSDVYVRGFEGDRAQIDVSLEGEFALGERLAAALPGGVHVTHAADSRLSLELGGARENAEN